MARGNLINSFSRFSSSMVCTTHRLKMGETERNKPAYVFTVAHRRWPYSARIGVDDKTNARVPGPVTLHSAIPHSR